MDRLNNRFVFLFIAFFAIAIFIGTYPKIGVIVISIVIIVVLIKYYNDGGADNPLLYQKKNIFEFLSYAAKIGQARIGFPRHRNQEVVIEILEKNGFKMNSEKDVRNKIRELLVYEEKVFEICSRLMVISHVIDGNEKYFNGIGKEVPASEYLNAEVLIDFQLPRSAEFELMKLLHLQNENEAATEQTEKVVLPLEKNTVDQLFKQALNYKGSEHYKRFFSFIAKFNHYSRYNSMLVYIQNPNVTFFGTSYFWRTKFQRTVKGNAKPHIILAPGGPVLLAYDIFDTCGKLPAKEFLEQGISKTLFEVKGNFQTDYLLKLKTFATRHGIKVEKQPMSFFQGGAVTTYITKKLEIYLREGNNERQHFSTLCHELAHVFLGHTNHKELIRDNNKRVVLPERSHLALKQEELEAETVNFLICKKLGLETQSMEYLAGYIESESDWKNFSYELVIKVADRLEGELK